MTRTWVCQRATGAARHTGAVRAETVEAPRAACSAAGGDDDRRSVAGAQLADGDPDAVVAAAAVDLAGAEDAPVGPAGPRAVVARSDADAAVAPGIRARRHVRAEAGGRERR